MNPLFNRSMSTPPHILFILADDLGYGDVSCYNPESKVQTPNLDRLAKEGLMFTDAHAPATVCSPSRYSCLTGTMAFRDAAMTGVFTGAGGPCMIKEDEWTLPRLLKDRGYTTAMFGKWHIGLTYLDKEGQPICENGIEPVSRIDYSRAIPDAPVHRGFDRFFGTGCCCGTDHLYAFIDGDRIPVPPDGMLDKHTLPDHDFAIDCRDGYIAPGYDIEEMDQIFLEKSVAFLKNHVAHQPEKPFFLFHSTNAVHLPSLPSKTVQGKSSAGPHGDFIVEFDTIVGTLMDTLDELGIAEDTLVIISSDNGPETHSVYRMRNLYNHDGARPWRGMKRDQWEGGHRVPMFARWPGTIEAGRVTHQTACLCDLMATCAAVAGAELPDQAGLDSFDLSGVLAGRQPEEEPVRRHTLHQTNQLKLAIRKGPWKYLDHQGSGGNDYDLKEILHDYRLPETAPDAPGQLYNLDEDPGETRNLYLEYPEKVKELKDQLDAYVAAGRSRP
jgi:arylsulfatase A-like enzyme